MEKITNKELMRLYAPVGEIVIQWAITDVTINHIAFVVFRALSQPERRHTWPKEFGRRLNLLEPLFPKNPMLRGYYKEVKPLFKRIRKLQELRDMLIHGVAVQYEPKKDAIQWQRVDRTTKAERARDPSTSHKRNGLTVRFAVLSDASDECLRINNELYALRARIAAI